MSAAEDSIRGQLEAAMRARAEPEVETPEAPEVEAPVAAAPEVETPAQERARDEKGRFAAKDGAERPDSTTAVVAEPTAGKPASRTGDKPDNATAAPQEPKPEAALAPPNGWTAEAKAKWHELPPEIMAAVQQREKDIAKFTSTRDEHASFGKEIYQTVQPYLATIKAEGGTPARAVADLLNTAYVLRTGTPELKRDLLLKTAALYGVDLGVAKPSAQPTNTGDPAFASMQNEIATLKNELAQFKQTGEQQLHAEVNAELTAFAADPAHPHYESVKAHMAALLNVGAAKDLKDAYEQAVYARPDTRATLLAQQRADEEQKRRADAKQKAEAAKRTNVSLTGGPGNTAQASAPAGRSIREELEAARSASSGAV